MASPFLEMPLRELEQIAKSTRISIVAFEESIASLKHTLGMAETAKAFQESRMDAIQDALVHRINKPTPVRFPAPGRELQDHVPEAQWRDEP